MCLFASYFPMTRDMIVKKLQSPEARAIQKKYHIKHLWLTGSYARGDADESSDIDFVFEEEKTPLLWDGDLKYDFHSTLKKYL